MQETNYRHRGVGVLRASAHPVTPARWPVLSCELDCRSWLAENWPSRAEAITHASPALAAQVGTILRGERCSPRVVRRTTLAVLRYVLRGGRSTPFGLFAGVAPVTVGADAAVRIGHQDRVHTRPDNRWLRRVIDQLEACPGLLEQLAIMFHTGVESDGERLSLAGTEVSIRHSPAVEFVRSRTTSPVRAGEVIEKLAGAFPHAGDPAVMVRTLLHHRFLISALHAPSTITDPLRHLTDALRDLDTDDLEISELISELHALQRAFSTHNQCPKEHLRRELAERMSTVATCPRGPLSLDLRLDMGLCLPESVAREAERTAGVLARVAREHAGSRAWREFAAAFCERYGTGTLVPLTTVLDPVTGIGWPQGYPAGPARSDRHAFSARDRLLLGWISEATSMGQREIDLDDAAIDALAAAGGEPDAIPAHVDFGLRIHATDLAALRSGEYRFTVAPGRVAGTLSSRFSTLVPDAGLDAVFGALPTTVADAIPAQVSFIPRYPSAENVSRVPLHLPEVVAIGEHRPPQQGVIGVGDLAITATQGRLHLVDMFRGRVIEPVILHALAPKQQPPLARLLGELPRALQTGWIGFDWGPVASAMPFLPRLRHRHAILTPARWHLTRTTVPDEDTLERWRVRWRCPQRVELREFDQHLPLDLRIPAHRQVLVQHLRQHSDATLTEAPAPGSDEWVQGRAHLVVLPLTSRRAPEPAPPVTTLPTLDRAHGQPPTSIRSQWWYLKVFLSQDRMDQFLVRALPDLTVWWDRAKRDWWFVRYPRTGTGAEPDHLRLRVRANDDLTDPLHDITRWADRLRTEGLLGRWAWDTYYPEVGRYHAIAEAEAVFAADSRYVLTRLTTTAPEGLSPVAVTGLALLDLAAAFLGGRDDAADWLCRHAPSAVPDREDVTALTRVMSSRRWPGEVEPDAITEALGERAEAVRRYRHALPEGVDLDSCLRALLHMHHNRALGVDRDREKVCLRLARQAATTWRATTPRWRA